MATTLTPTPPTKRGLAPGERPSFLRQVIGFLSVGALCTASYVVLYLALREVTGTQLANFLASLTTAVMNTALNRVFTFNIRGKDNLSTHHAQGILVFLFGWFLTSMSLIVLHHTHPEATATTEMIVLTIANLVATVLRFTLFKVWVFSFKSKRNQSHFGAGTALAAAAAAITVAGTGEAAPRTPDLSSPPSASAVESVSAAGTIEADDIANSKRNL